MLLPLMLNCDQYNWFCVNWGIFIGVVPLVVNLKIALGVLNLKKQQKDNQHFLILETQLEVLKYYLICWIG
jgi:hypothetical protein